MSTEEQPFCKICGRSINDYNKSWPCAKNHKWQKKWRLDKQSEKYKSYLEKRHISMQLAARRRLDAMNKKTPPEYQSRHNSTK